MHKSGREEKKISSKFFCGLILFVCLLFFSGSGA
jgi:hypothetical protein